MTNKITLAVLVTILVSFTVWCLAHPDADNHTVSTPQSQGSAYVPTQAQVEHNAKHDALVARLAELNQIEDKINCPSFFDAPLGNKPCPAHEFIERGKAIIQEELDSTN
jgi:hypothetical protein